MAAMEVDGVENPIPRISILPWTGKRVLASSAITVLAAFVDDWGMKIKYEVTPLENGTGPTTYKAEVTVGMRKGYGYGATYVEAKATAAATCLEELAAYVPDEVRVTHRPVIITDPAKDILYILKGICSDYGFEEPTYIMSEKKDESGGFYCTARMGELSEIGEAQKKRVAIRFAALNLYNKIRDLYNKGELKPTNEKN